MEVGETMDGGGPGYLCELQPRGSKRGGSVLCSPKLEGTLRGTPDSLFFPSRKPFIFK